MKHCKKQKWCLVGVLLLLSCLMACSSGESYRKYELFAMDTIMTWTLWEDEKGDAGEQIRNVISHAEKQISVTDPESELYFLNQQAGNHCSISEDMAELLRICLEYGENTDYAFNIALYPILQAWGFTAEEHRVPSQMELEELLNQTDLTRIELTETSFFMPDSYALDLGAVGKGYVTDLCVDVLKTQGITSGLLDLGGNVYAHGAKEDGSAWRIGIQMPFGNATDYAGIVSVKDRAVVTSGTYQRYFEEDGKHYHHILDGDTGRPVENELDSVTIITQEGMMADALSTAYFVMGLEASAEHWREQSDVEVIWITKDQKVYYTEGLMESFSVTEGLDSEVLYR